jgi:hypothetical protein
VRAPFRQQAIGRAIRCAAAQERTAMTSLALALEMLACARGWRWFEKRNGEPNIDANRQEKGAA